MLEHWTVPLVSGLLAIGCAQAHERSHANAVQMLPDASGHDSQPMAADSVDASMSEPDDCSNCDYPAQGADYGAISCCSQRGHCGLSFPNAGFPQCFEHDSPGRRDPTCPDFQATIDVLGIGCCRSDGTCGVFDPVLGLGCVQLPFLKIQPCD
jgi:hypothetical protein